MCVIMVLSLRLTDRSTGWGGKWDDRPLKGMRIKSGTVEGFDSLPSHIIKSPSERYLVGREVKGSSFYMFSCSILSRKTYRYVYRIILCA